MTLIEIAFGRSVELSRDFAIELGYYCVYGVTLTLINSAYFDYLNNRVNWGKFSRYRIFIGALGSVALTLAAIFFIRMFLSVAIEGETMASFISNERPKFYIISLLITMVISLFFHAVYFYKRNQEVRIKEQKIIAGTASAKFESLKNQIDPHFLFNSLNVLSSLIEENPEQAQKFTTSLSKVYRYVLEQKDKELVSVDEELSFAKTYMNLLKMRFENSLFFELPESVPNPDAKVVPLSLQLLLENTVKHNVASEQRPLKIKIFIDGDYLVIENNYQKKEVLQDGQGVGLQNIISRYGIITRRSVLIDQTDKAFTVKIPILTKQISVAEAAYSDAEHSYLNAAKKMEDIKGFYGNLISYIIVITGLAVLNLATYPQYWWFLYPALGWGIGVVIHAAAVYSLVPFLGKDWEERKIREIIEKEKIKKWN
ncbi:MAG: histidine kinase [Flavobacterium sp.]|nr:MAG: histidine kinase [Flavobacterium sp.]